MPRTFTPTIASTARAFEKLEAWDAPNLYEPRDKSLDFPWFLEKHQKVSSLIVIAINNF